MIDVFDMRGCEERETAKGKAGGTAGGKAGETGKWRFVRAWWRDERVAGMLDIGWLRMMMCTEEIKNEFHIHASLVCITVFCTLLVAWFTLHPLGFFSLGFHHPRPSIPDPDRVCWRWIIGSAMSGRCITSYQESPGGKFSSIIITS